MEVHPPPQRAAAVAAVIALFSAPEDTYVALLRLAADAPVNICPNKNPA